MNIDTVKDNILNDILSSDVMKQSGITELPLEYVDEILCDEDYMKYEFLPDGEVMKLFGQFNEKSLGFMEKHEGHYVVETAGRAGRNEGKFFLVQPIRMIRTEQEDVLAGDFIMCFYEADRALVEYAIKNDLTILALAGNKYALVKDDSVIEVHGLKEMLAKCRHIFRIEKQKI